MNLLNWLGLEPHPIKRVKPTDTITSIKIDKQTFINKPKEDERNSTIQQQNPEVD